MSIDLHNEIEKEILNKIIDDPTISQNKLATECNTSQPNVHRIIKRLGYTKLNNKYIFISDNFQELQFNALKYLISLSPLKIQSSIRYLGKDIQDDSLTKIYIYTIVISIDEVHKNSIYALLTTSELINPISTYIGYGCITFNFDSNDNFKLFINIIDKLSNPSCNLHSYNRARFLTEIYKLEN